MMAWMATWWMTEAVEIEVTSLLPIVAFPLLGVMPLGKTTANYGADVIYLFLGGFVLALAIQRWGLDRRIAFLTLRLVGTRPEAIVAGIMGATAFLSMWVSNTATAAMMVPIALSVIDLVLLRPDRQDAAPSTAASREDDRDVRNFALSAAVGRRLRGVDRRPGDDHRFAAERDPRALRRADLRRRGRRSLDWMLIGVPTMLTVPAAGVVPEHDGCCFRRA